MKSERGGVRGHERLIYLDTAPTLDSGRGLTISGILDHSSRGGTRSPGGAGAVHPRVQTRQSMAGDRRRAVDMSLDSVAGFGRHEEGGIRD